MRPLRQLLQRRRAVLFSLALLFCAMPRVGYGQGKTPGQEEPVNVGDISLTFHYCPAGKVVRGNPLIISDLEKASEPVGPFYMSESEISQEQFDYILANDDKWSRMTQPPKGLRTSSEEIKKYIEKLDSSKVIGDKFPIYSLTISEAVQFCISVQQLYDGSSPSAGLIRRTFRLPTNAEWQYACRARELPDQQRSLPHFGIWADYKTIDTKIQKLCAERWKGPSPFRGEQAEFEKLLERANAAETQEILNEFLEKGVGLRNPFGTPNAKAPLLQVTAGNSNTWRLRLMHGNVEEWTLKGRGDWEMLHDNYLNDPKSPSGKTLAAKKLVLAGGHFHTKFARGQWKDLTVWQGVEVSYKNGIDTSSSLFATYEGGVRLVMELEVRLDGWLADTRNELRALPPGRSNKLTTLLGGLENDKKTVDRLLDGDKAKTTKGQLDYYASLLQFKAGNIDKAINSLKDAKATATSIQQDPYFELLEPLFVRDKEAVR